MGLDMYIVDEEGQEIFYWRKFNALHSYFVKHLQDGVDECQRSRQIKKEDAEQILFILENIKEFPLSAQVYMPTSSGFFFGSTSYDEYFHSDVEKSIPIFQDMLERIERGDKLYYQSSW